MKIIHRYNWFLISLAVILLLFVSSSMTYHEQTVVPLLSRWLPATTTNAFLNGIHFDYAGMQVSVASMGLPAFCEFFLRKLAHFSIFFVFGAASFLGLSRRVGDRLLAGITAVLAASGVAALDEFHQMLTQGRSPLFQDVILDTVGALCGVLLTVLIVAVRRQKHA